MLASDPALSPKINLVRQINPFAGTDLTQRKLDNEWNVFILVHISFATLF